MEVTPDFMLLPKRRYKVKCFFCQRITSSEWRAIWDVYNPERRISKMAAFYLCDADINELTRFRREDYAE